MFLLAAMAWARRLLAFPDVVFVVAWVTGYVAVVDFERNVRERIQQEAFVGDQKQCALEDLQATLKPFHGGGVEIIRRFVEKQDVRFAEKRSGHAGAHLPAAGEGAHRTLQVLLTEAEALQGGFGAMTHLVAAKMFEMGLKTPQLVEKLGLGFGVGPLRQLGLDLVDALLKLGKFAGGGGDVGHDGLVVLEEVELLLEEAYPGLARNGDFALVGGHLAEIMLKIVDLPAPLGPTSPTRSSLLTRKDASSRMALVPKSFYFLEVYHVVPSKA
jgi:hypothetical protein